MRNIALVLALAFLSACGSLPAPSIESSLAAVRQACAAIGSYDLDECAADLETAAAQESADAGAR